MALYVECPDHENGRVAGVREALRLLSRTETARPAERQSVSTPAIRGIPRTNRTDVDDELKTGP